MKHITSALGGFIQIILILLVILAFLIGLLSKKEGLLGYKAFVIFTGSMSPAINPSGLIIVRPQPAYAIGDIITFYQNDQNGIRQPLPVTHRVTQVKTGQNTGFITQGDANTTPDPAITPLSSVIGKVVFHLPYVGRFTDFSRSQLGFILLIVIPLTIVAYQEYLNLKSEISRLLSRRPKDFPVSIQIISRPTFDQK